MHLLTWHGSVICRPDAQGAITHQKLPLPAEAPAPMVFEPESLAPRTQLRHPELGLMRIEPAERQGGLHFLRDGLYMCAEAPGTLRWDRTDAAGWETFLAISDATLADLQHILRFRWIIRDTRRVIRRRDIGLDSGFVLRVGAYRMGVGHELDSAIAGRGPAGLPDTLMVREDGASVALVIAEPRSSALVETALWPVRARRTAEIAAFAAHRHVIGLEPTQDAFERDTAFLQANRGAAGLSDLLEDLDDHLEALQAAQPTDRDSPRNAGADRGARRDEVLMAWALREMAPWLLRPVDPDRAGILFDDLNATQDWAYVYDFSDGDVAIRPKPPSLPESEVALDRAGYYLGLFKAAAGLLPPTFKTSLCLGVADGLPDGYDIPLFCFQKRMHQTSILLPDIDFFLGDFHRGERYEDRISYDAKSRTAVFAGSTTGGTITPEVARTLSLPRLRAARFFASHTKVDFRLPQITQCTTDEAEAILAEKSFCRAQPLSWQQQFEHRFIISMDGNGATCSRVVVALNSNSVLLKYNSNNMLYYFGGLQPWLHYIPIGRDRDVDRVIALETLIPDAFRRIAENGRAFAQTYLSEDAIYRYTASLLQLYAHALSGAGGTDMISAILPIGASAAAAAATTIVAHIENRGDTTFALDEWVGEPGSGMAMEGFAIFVAETLPENGISYQAVLEDGSLTDRVASPDYCGTRGEGLPIYGLCVTLREGLADAYDLVYEASFIDGSDSGPVSSGTVCKAELAIPMEAFRISIHERKHAGAEGK